MTFVSHFEMPRRAALLDELRALPKAELHAHLVGCVPIETLADVVGELAIDLPYGLTTDDMVIREPRKGLDEYLQPWAILKLLPRTERVVRRLAAAAAQTLSSDGVVYAELRASPLKIASVAAVSLDVALLWLLNAFEEAADTAHVDLRLVVNVTRGRHTPDEAHRLLDAMSRRSSSLLVGVDLSGDELLDPPDWMAPFLHVLRTQLQLGVSIHAGETGSRESVLWAIQRGEADRIGHGLALMRDPALRRLAITNDICVEVCINSNYYSGQVRTLDEHPFRLLVESHVPFVLCADNPSIHGKTLSDDYAAFLELTGRPDILETMLARQRQYAFARST